MDRPPERPAAVLPDLFAWARAGLLRFETPDCAAAEPLRTALASALSGYAGMHWAEIDLLLAERVRDSGTGLAALVRDPPRDLPRLYLLTLAAAVELDAAAAPLLARIQGAERPGWLRVGTAEAVLRALFPRAPALEVGTCDLADSRLILLDGTGPLVLQHLYTAADHWKALTEGRLPRELSPIPDPGREGPGDAGAVARGAAALTAGRGLAVKADTHAGRALTARIAARVERRPVAVSHEDWRQRSVRAVCRLSGWLPLVDCRELDSAPIDAPEIARQAVLLLRGDQPVPDGWLELPAPPDDAAGRRRWWRTRVPDQALLEPLAAARLGRGALERIAGQLGDEAGADLLRRVRQVRTGDGSAGLRRVALPVDTHVDDGTLVLPADTAAALERCRLRCLRREYADLGMGPSIRATAGTGVVLLFAGASGTGKTLAASWLASRLGAPLFKIDLAMVMNKYVGETEKNLSLALDEAARADVMLLFDEADALFGKRSDGSHGGDRFANMLTNFLLARIETHPGIVVLTTNAGNRMDGAFLRRIDVAVEFKPLDPGDRVLLWQRLLAERDPGGELARRIARHCELAPGHVRNVVVNACCWYPDERPLSPRALWQALDEEYRKASRSMPSQLMALRDAAAGPGDG